MKQPFEISTQCLCFPFFHLGPKIEDYRPLGSNLGFYSHLYTDNLPVFGVENIWQQHFAVSERYNPAINFIVLI